MSRFPLAALVAGLALVLVPGSALATKKAPAAHEAKDGARGATTPTKTVAAVKHAAPKHTVAKKAAPAAKHASASAPSMSVAVTATEPERDPEPAAKPHGKEKKDKGHGAKKAKPACLRAPVDVLHGKEALKFPLTKCDGSLAPLALEQLSILARAGSAARPKDPIAVLGKVIGKDLAPGVRRLDPRLVDRLQTIVDHFGKPGTDPKISLVSGYRPSSSGSYHANGRALDLRIDGVKNEDLVAFCKTLPDTGCGYYPNSSFVHVDVRDEGAGHVAWIDASGPGEQPKYVSVWPPPPDSNDTPVGDDVKPSDLPDLPPGDHPIVPASDTGEEETTEPGGTS